MQQLEIKYFFPLTEQIDLDLDFSPCQEFSRQKYTNQVIGIDGLCLTVGNGGTTWATVSNIEPSFCIDVDQTPITIVSKEKPSFIKRYIYKALGMKWKAK